MHRQTRQSSKVSSIPILFIYIKNMGPGKIFISILVIQIIIIIICESSIIKYLPGNNVFLL